MVTFAEGKSQSSIEALRSVFLSDIIDRNDLSCTGGGQREWHYTITRPGDQATDADRELVARWCAQFSDMSCTTSTIHDVGE